MNSNRFTVKFIVDPDALLDWVVAKAIEAGSLVRASGSIRAMLEREVAHLHKVGFLPVPAVSEEYLRDALATFARPMQSFLCNETIPSLLAEFMHRLLVAEEPIEFQEVVLRLADIAGLNLTATDDAVSGEVLIESPIALAETYGAFIHAQLPQRLRKLGRA